MTKQTSRQIQPSPKSPSYLVDYDCPDLAAKVAAMVGMDMVQMNALRVAIATTEETQADWMRDALLASAEAYIAEVGHNVTVRG